MGGVWSETINTHDDKLIIDSANGVVVTLPATIYKKSTQSNHDSVRVIMTHGLGARNPRKKSHKVDKWISSVALPGALQTKRVVNVIAYTARGHGLSTGWQETAAVDCNQFVWSRLSMDMHFIINSSFISSSASSKIVVCGSSMGGATSLYTAMQYPKQVHGLIMIRPPTGWEARKDRRVNLMSSLQKFKKNHASDQETLLYASVLSGAQEADFPPLGSLLYKQIKCPVLFLAVENDHAHPVLSAKILKNEMPSNIYTELHIVQNLQEATRKYPEIIQRFITKHV
jgi:pimeloyl-ACP methyl ester carboxylesterase